MDLEGNEAVAIVEHKEVHKTEDSLRLYTCLLAMKVWYVIS